MFSIKDRLNKKFTDFTVNNRVKAYAGQNFSGNLKELKTSRNEQIDRQIKDDSVTYFDVIMNEATTFLKRLVNNQEIDGKEFIRVAENLSKAMSLRPSNPNPYYYMSWLFVFTEDNETAQKYLDITKEINPYYEVIESLQGIIKPETKAVKPIPKPSPPATPVFKPRVNRNLSGAASAYARYGSY